MVNLNISRFFRRGRSFRELRESEEFKIMHLSDTPDNVYPFILNLIEKTHPDVIIHTGDLVDNVKLERKPELRGKYEASLVRILSILENSGAEVFIVPGNEDDEGLIRVHAERAVVVKPGTVIELEGVKLALGHSSADVENVDATFRLYGHNFKVIPRGLNGVLNVNFILLPSRRIVRIKYPDGTNFERGYKLMRGL
ncbi:metallophosphoesterase family protein [Palaeococcus ferrophilus]|uniref:metallophosphoesterase family protein n=1 Tax=Palaeococcus ferrophilus TaxID=83868 RepID=UPI00064FB373|nr:metallophosphoesterase [Palaeococcus ferrophilus]